jgi:hypothetical protein
MSAPRPSEMLRDTRILTAAFLTAERGAERLHQDGSAGGADWVLEHVQLTLTRGRRRAHFVLLSLENVGQERLSRRHRLR